MAFVVNRDRFLVLAAALASSTCGDSRPARTPPRAEPNVAIAEPEAETETEEPGVVEEPAALGDTSGTCDNDAGEIDCTTIARYEIGPSCEGLAGSCNLLTKGYGFKRRIGAAIAKCWEGLGPGACNIKARERCNRQAVQSACPDPRFEPQCQAALDSCKAAHKRTDYTLDECVKVMSSLDDSNRNWAIGQMGPAAEGCRLMFPVY